jgi:arylsulfatase A-like enzyme
MSRLSAALRFFATAILPGVLVYGVLFGLSVGFHASADYMGVEDTSVTTQVMQLFEQQILAQQLEILTLYLALGVALSLFSALLLQSLRALRRRPPSRPLAHFSKVALLVLTQHLTLLLASMALHPSLYAFSGEQFAPMGLLLSLAVALPLELALALPFILPAILLIGALLLAFRYLRTAPTTPLTFAITGLSGLTLGALTLTLTHSPRLTPHRTTDLATRPNVLVLAVDSLRTDLIETHPDTIPNLIAFSKRATLFSRAVPTVPRTYSSWASMLTGLYPHDHGIRHMFPVPVPGLIVKDALPETLGREGYRTGVVSDFAGDVFTRGDWGFEHVDTARFTLASNVSLAGLKLHLHLLPWLVEVFDLTLYRDDLLALERLSDPADVEDAALDFIAKDPDRPFFLVAFFSAGHFPFASPAPYWHRFTNPEYRGRSRFLKQSFGKVLDDASVAAEKNHLFGLYRGAIAASDDAMGRLLTRLEVAGVLDHTIVIITADHGENVYEHGLGVGHGDHLYGRTTLEVPFLLDYPNNPHRGARIDTPISLASLAPTVESLTGIPSPPRPPSPFAGVDLTSNIAQNNLPPIFSEIDLWFFPPETHRLDGKRIVSAEGFSGFTFDPQNWAIYLDVPFQPHALLAKHRMVMDAQRKLLYIPTREGVHWELYDPMRDPGDMKNLASAEPETVSRMRDLLWQWMLKDPLIERRRDFALPRETPPEVSK